MPPKKRARRRPAKSADATPDQVTEETEIRRKKTQKSKSAGKEEGTDGDAPVGKAAYCHWLMKSEPESRFENGVDVKFGIEDLKALPNQTGCWDGVRNYQARNFMRDMKVQQLAFFYHSNCKEPGIAGLMKIVKEAYVDHTQFDRSDAHYDASSKLENPKWYMVAMCQVRFHSFSTSSHAAIQVDVQFERMTKRFLPLAELKKYHLRHKAEGGALGNLALFTRARLSVQPLTAEEFDFVLSLEDRDPI